MPGILIAVVLGLWLWAVLIAAVVG